MDTHSLLVFWCLIFGLPGWRFWLFWSWNSTVEMDASPCDSPVRKYVDDYNSMRLSNDTDRSDPVSLSSMGVVDLDTSIVPDVFGLWASDSESPITRILTGQFRNELRLLIPDSGIALEPFHDIVITDLTATPEWRTARLAPSDVTSLRRRWPKILFRTMHHRQEEMEQLHHSCRDRPERAFRQGHPGYCPECKQDVAITLDRHMMNTHLELGQLWRCPVEWCTVWKGSVRDCLDHLREKHGGSQFDALKNLGKFFPPWTVPRDFWHAALRPGISGMAVSSSFMIRDADWYTSIRSTGIPSLIRCCGRGLSGT